MMGTNEENKITSRRAELLALLRRDGILYSGPGQPIRTGAGEYADWALYSWNVSLTAEGSFLAGRCLLDRLESFKSTQLATIGYTAVPLMSACVLLGEGRYVGACVREERKRYGACRRVEGPLSRSQPVVLVDDALSSGSTMRRAIQALEEEGFQVEGAVCLVHFPGHGGAEWARALGYRIETLFDVWDDLKAPRPDYVPAFKRVAVRSWADEQIPDGLCPVDVVQLVTRHYLTHRTVPAPPLTLDRHYDSTGGTFVSFRERNTERRLARDGFWHFEARDADTCRDLVLATVKTLDSSNGAISPERLPELKIGVNFLGALEEITPSQLDFSQYGIVVRSKTADARMAGALPNTQAFTSEIEQYHHALVTNGRMSHFEPHSLYRHTVAKHVQPGEYWLPFGSTEDPTDERVAWSLDGNVGRLLVGFAREALSAYANGQPIREVGLPADLIPAPVSAVAVTLFKNGPIGCSLSWGASLDACVARATVQAWQDHRFDKVKAGVKAEEVAVSVSVLHDREWLGAASLERVAFLLRRGLDSLAVQQGEKQAIFLSYVAPYYNWTKETMCRQLLKKAGIAASPYEWATFRTTSWVGYGTDVHRLVYGLPVPSAEAYTQAELEGDIELLGTYIANNIGQNGLPEYLQLPVDGRRFAKGSSARVLHAVAALDAAGQIGQRGEWLDTARRGLELCLASIDTGSPTGLLNLPGYSNGVAADCQLLSALVKRDDGLGIEWTHVLAESLTRFLQPDGRIAAPGNGPGLAADHDFLPGCILWALGEYIGKMGHLEVAGEADRHLDWYRRRFHLLHPWGMVIWQTQAWAAMYRAMHKPAYADFVFEIADWALEWQLEKDGSFLCDLSATSPSFHTAAIAEGIADAWSLATEVGDSSRAEKYALSWAEAARFTRTLVVRQRDTFCMYDPNRAVGGVRSTPGSTDVRIDFVSHALTALLKGYSGPGAAARYLRKSQQERG